MESGYRVTQLIALSHPFAQKSGERMGQRLCGGLRLSAVGQFEQTVPQGLKPNHNLRHLRRG
jgi:hypothetical protein